MRPQFCPKCGREAKIVGTLCEQCVSEMSSLVEVPSRITIKKCRNCGKFYRNQKWTRGVDETTLIRDEIGIKGVARVRVVKNEDYVVYATGSVEDAPGVEKTEEHHIDVRVSRALCDSCVRSTGGYYVAILQIRSKDEERIDAVLAIVAEQLKYPQADYWFVSKTERVRGGVDLYMGSKKLLAAVEKQARTDLGAESVRSYKLAGKIDNEDVYRNVVALRV